MDRVISLQAAIDALNYELDAIDHVPKWVFDRLTKCIEQLPSAQPESAKRTEETIQNVPDTDLISRKTAIDAFYLQSDDDGWWTGTAQDAEELLNGLPSAQPERKTGEWLYGEDDGGQDGWTCSECGFFVPWYYRYNKNIDFIWKYKTCPCCDAKMLTYTGKDGGGA